MKYAFMTFSTPTLSLADALATARRHGYDGIEPRLDAQHAHGVEVAADPAQRAAIRQQAAASGVALACLATSLRYADPAQTDDMLSQTRARIDLAADVGAPVLRVFGGQIPAGLARAAATDLLVRSLRAVADHAAARGVTVALETHDDWCDPRHVAAVMRGVNHPAIGVNWDIMHPVRAAQTDVATSFALLQPWIRHLHVHDGPLENPLRFLPIGQGAIDHRTALRLLRESGYAGFISGEWINWEPADIHLPRERAALQACERD